VPELTYKQRLFVTYYLGESQGNAADAARRAGYGSPEVYGPRLVKKRSVLAAIDAKLDEASLTTNEVLARLAEHATASIEDYIEVDAAGSYRVNLLKAKKARKLGLVKRIKAGEYGVELQLTDPLKALELLGKYRGVFKADAGSQDPSFAVVVNVNPTQRSDRRPDGSDGGPIVPPQGDPG
jgi:phage terminase small subunit